MPDDFAAAIDRARALVLAGKPQEATRLIRQALSRQGAIDPTVDPVTDPRPLRRVDPANLPDAEILPGPAAPKVVPLSGRRPAPRRTPAPGTATSGRHRIETPEGARDYTLFLPDLPPDTPPAGLILMLHGCTQTPEDFALGTRMNQHAQQAGLIVAYPAQTRGHNPQGCWNWFRPADQRRDRGEPAILAALARQLAADHRLPPHRLFAAGLSAGGAMAAILGHEYPDLFSAIAIHSGLAAGAASDVASAFAAMRGDGPAPAAQRGGPRIITFHGSADATVHPANSAQIMAAARHGGTAPRITTGTAQGRAFTRSQTFGPDGQPLTEHWEIEGSGHAWSGGSPSGSHADPSGPDASALMIDFFLGQPGRT